MVAGLSRDLPAVITREDLRDRLTDIGSDRDVHTSIDELRRLGWLVGLPIQGTWAFIPPGQEAVADPYLALRAWLARDPDTEVMLAGAAAACRPLRAGARTGHRSNPFEADAVPSYTRTRPVSAAQVQAYVSKAEEYLSAATAELDADRSIAATSLAIHAGINAADAVTGVRLGVRAAGQDHEEAIVLLRTAGPDGVAVAKELGRLLPMKTRAEYELDDIPKSGAAGAVERARRMVGVARRIASVH